MKKLAQALLDLLRKCKKAPSGRSAGESRNGSEAHPRSFQTFYRSIEPFRKTSYNRRMEQNTNTSQTEQGVNMSQNNASKPKKRGFFWWVGLIVLILVVLSILGALRRNSTKTNNTVNTTNSATSSTSTSTKGTSNAALPGVYRNANLGYKVNYPSGWIIDSASVAVVGVALKESDAADAPAVDIYAIPNNDNIDLAQAKKTYTSGSALLGTSNILTFRVKSETQTTFLGKDAYEVVTTFKSKATNEDAQGKMIIFQSGGK